MNRFALAVFLLAIGFLVAEGGKWMKQVVRQKVALLKVWFQMS